MRFLPAPQRNAGLLLIALVWRLIAPTALSAAADEWADTFFNWRVPLAIDAPAPGEYLLDLDAYSITEWINEADVFGFKPECFAYDNVRLVEVQADGSEKPVDASFRLVVGPERVTNGGFEVHADGKPAGWTVAPEGFTLQRHADGSGWYLAVEGADRNACHQIVPTAQRTWYRFSCRILGSGSAAPYIRRVTDSGWQIVDSSWYDPYIATGAWREVNYGFFTGDKSDWKDDILDLRIERYTGAADDISLRACGVGLVARFDAGGAKNLRLYYAPLEGVMPSPPSRVVSALPEPTLATARAGPVEGIGNGVAYGLAVSNDAFDVWYAAPTHKVLEQEPPPAATRDTIRWACARNEAEPIQVVLRPKSHCAIQSVTVSLRSARGREIPAGNIEIRQAHYVPVIEPSKSEYDRPARSRFTGRLPDPLPVFAPVEVGPGDANALLWADVKTPADFPAGACTGRLEIATSAGTLAIPLELTVWDFALPDRATFRTSLQFSRYANSYLFPFHKVETREDKYGLSRAYTAAMAQYRVTETSPQWSYYWLPDRETPSEDPLDCYTNELPWAMNDLHVNSFSMSHVSGPSLGDATTETGRAAADALAPVLQYLAGRDWLRWGLIQIDEPQPIHYAGVRRWIQGFREAPPGGEAPMFAFVYNPECYDVLRDSIDIMTPINNDGFSIVSPLANARAPDGQETWFYFTRSARMWLDAPGIDQRLWAPSVWAWGGQGIGVWAINLWWEEDGTSATGAGLTNPWTDPRTPWGNGALAYFYPPSALGTNLPAKDLRIVPSLRLLLTRDGIEDVEYAAALERLLAEDLTQGRAAAAARAALAMFRRAFVTPQSWILGDAYWMRTRAAMAEARLGLTDAQANAVTHTWGHDFVAQAESAGSMTIGTANPREARFTAPSSMTVTGAVIYLNLATDDGAGNYPLVTLGLQADNGSGGNSGTYLGSGTTTMNAAGLWSVDFGSSVSLTAGSVYHFVAENSVPVSLAFWRAFGGMTPSQPQSHFPDPMWGCGNAYGTVWTNNNCVYLLKTASGNNFGEPFGGEGYYSVHGNNIYGERFTYEGAPDEHVVGAKMRFYVGASTPADDLKFALLSLSNTLLASGTVSAASATLNAANNYFVTLSGAPVLAVGTEYRLVACSPGAAVNEWQIELNTTWYPSDSAFNSATFQAMNAYATYSTTTSDPTAGTYYNRGDNYDAYFVLYTVPCEGTAIRLR